ncbi:MAG: RNA-binding S4 domain-containing protein [Christensenellaceae bacterium]|jgi:ribosomal 50S subunit-recycling heat shock protein|nr:RNA-binding S4 domain-containing protein [Christensenellaceae bacterium]
MRLDKFLKVSRIIKRRTVANEACDVNRVLINALPAKPSRVVKVGDIISIRFGDKIAKFKVKEIPNGNVSKEKADELYELLNE